MRGRTSRTTADTVRVTTERCSSSGTPHVLRFATLQPGSPQPHTLLRAVAMSSAPSPSLRLHHNGRRAVAIGDGRPLHNELKLALTLERSRIRGFVGLRDGPCQSMGALLWLSPTAFCAN